MDFRARQEAQKIILRRCGAIETEGDRTVPTEIFHEKASRFAELKKQGKNLIEIERELRS